MFTWLETKPFTAHMPAHYYSVGGSLVYRMRAVDQFAEVNYSQDTGGKLKTEQRYQTFKDLVLPCNNGNKICQ